MNNLKYWEEEGFLFAVPDEYRDLIANALEQKAKEVRDGKDFKDQPEDYEQLVITQLDDIQIWKDNEEFIDED